MQIIRSIVTECVLHFFVIAHLNNSFLITVPGKMRFAIANHSKVSINDALENTYCYEQ